MDRMLKTRDVAEALSVSIRWVQEQCSAGEIRSIRLNGADGQYRIFPEELARLKGQKPEKSKRSDYREAQLAMVRLGLMPPDADDPPESSHSGELCERQSDPAGRPDRRSPRRYRSRVGQKYAAAGKE